jgi:hypothetical protein
MKVLVEADNNLIKWLSGYVFIDNEATQLILAFSIVKRFYRFFTLKKLNPLFRASQESEIKKHCFLHKTVRYNHQYYGIFCEFY